MGLVFFNPAVGGWSTGEGVKLFWRPAWGGWKNCTILLRGGWKIHFEVIQNCTFLLKGVKIFSFFTLGGSKNLLSLRGGSKLLSCQFKFDHPLLLGHIWPTPYLGWNILCDIVLPSIFECRYDPLTHRSRKLRVETRRDLFSDFRRHSIALWFVRHFDREV